MAFDTLRANKMRSALTVLGVVIGVTSIVGMTSLIRGFDTSLRDSINALGPEDDLRPAVRRLSFSSGASFLQLMRRPVLTVDDGEAIRRLATTVAHRRHLARRRRRRSRRSSALFYRGERTRARADHGHDRALRRRQLRQDVGRPRLHRAGSQPPAQRRGDRLRAVPGAVRPSAASIRSARRCAIGAVEYTIDRRRSASGRPPAASASARTTSPSSPTRRSASSSAARRSRARPVRRHRR